MGVAWASHNCLLCHLVCVLTLTACNTHAATGDHPDLAGLLSLKASVCSREASPCAELQSWNVSTNVCTWEGVYCGYMAGEWRAVSIHLQLDAKTVLLNDSALEVDGAVPQIKHLRELEVLCIKNKQPAGPTPANVHDMLYGGQVRQGTGFQDLQSYGLEHSLGSSAPSAVSGSFATAAAAAAAGSALGSLAGAINSSNVQGSGSNSESGNRRGSLSTSTAFDTSVAASATAPGDLPPGWFQAYPHLSTLRVVGCGVTGTLPKALTAARQLGSLVLSHNKLTGSLPRQMVQLQGLMLLDLSHNHITGTLPRHWSSLTQLSYLYLNSNNITLAELPCEWGSGMLSLKLADLSGNRGTKPRDLSAQQTAAAVAAAASMRCGRFSSAVGAPAAIAAVDGASSMSRTLLARVLRSSQRAAAAASTSSSRGSKSGSNAPGGVSSSSSSSGSSGSGEDGDGSGSAQYSTSLYAPRCWLRRFCYQEGAFICLQRHPRHPAGGCTSYVYGASDLHIDPANQCDHGGAHLVAIPCLWAALLSTLLLIWLHHCRLLRWMVQPPPDQPPQPWQQPYQRQWLVTGPPLTTTSSSSRADQTLPLLYNQPRTRDDAAGYARPASPFSAAMGGAASPLDSVKSETLPSALVTPPVSTGGVRYMLVRGFGLTTAFSSGLSESDGTLGSGSGRLSRPASGRTTPVPGLGRDGSSSCFSSSLTLPLVALLLDVITDVRLVLLWGLMPVHVKRWPAYVLLGFLCVPHVLVGAVVNFRLLAAACLPPALEAASPGLMADILPPGALLIKRLYGQLFAAPWFVAYPLILVMLGPMIGLLSALCPLTLLIHAVGLASHESVVRYLQLVQGCAALTEAPGSAGLLTVLFLMGNVPLEWAFLDSALYYLNIVASMADIAVAWWIKLAGIRRQQLLELASPSTGHW